MHACGNYQGAMHQHSSEQPRCTKNRYLSISNSINAGTQSLAQEKEYTWLANERVRLVQRYLFAKGAFEAFPKVHYPNGPRIGGT
jgi:hypothetical protein